MFICKNCGQTYPVYSNFCTKCGSNTLEEVVEAPVTPAYDAPTVGAYEAPTAPTYEEPAVPAYEAPVAPAYEAPTAPAYEAPTAPAYEAPAAPAYEAPVYNNPVNGPAYGGPAYGAPVGGPAYNAPGYEMPNPYAAATPAPASGGSKVKGIVGMILSIVSAFFTFIAFISMCEGFSYMESWYRASRANDSGAAGFILALFFALPMGIVGWKLASGAMDNGFSSGISKAGKIVGLIAWISAAVVGSLSIFPMSW